MSQDFYEALKNMRNDHAAENPDFTMPLERVYDDVMELAARMGVESKAGIKVVGSSDHNDTKMIVDVDDETLRLIFGNADPKDWDGEGLPPVGCVCEALTGPGGGEKQEWFIGIVVANHINGGVIFESDNINGWRRFEDSGSLRPLPTEREKAIDAMYMDVTGETASHDEMMDSDGWDYLAATYDKGYRKQEPKP